MSPKEVLEFAKKNDAKQLDLRFTDIPGLQHHVSYPIGEVDESSFEEGFGMDGSSIRGWAAIHESDMLLIPDPDTAIMDPFAETPTLVMIGNAKDPVTKQRYERDPRWIGQKAELYLKNSGVADTAYFGAEAEFFIFDNVSFDQNQHEGFYFIDAEEGRWNSARRENNLGYRPRYKEGYFPVPPTDHYQDLRSEMVQTMIKCGIEHRVPPSRSGHRRPGRNRSAVRQAGEIGRQHDAVQVHRPQRGQSVRQDGDVHAQAAVRGQRQRDAHAPEPVEGRASRCSPETAMRASARWGCTTSAGC